MKSLLLVFAFAMTMWADAHIFVYHRFGDSRHPSTDTTISRLTKEFKYFKSHGYKVIPLKKLVRAVKDGSTIQNNWVVLTIDDNFKSFYNNGLEIFKKYKYPFSLFVYVKATQDGYSDYLSWKELKKISKYGSLEFHSYAHPHMTKLSSKNVIDDFKKGLKLFEDNLHIKPKYFAYPYGEYDSRIKKIAKSFGFEAIMNQNIGAISNDSDIYDLDRNALVGKSNLKYLLKFKHLNATWIKPNSFPKNGILKALHVETNTDAKNGGLYITGNSWRKIEIKNGIVDIPLNVKLKHGRNRVIISIKNAISTKFLIKDNKWN